MPLVSYYPSCHKNMYAYGSVLSVDGCFAKFLLQLGCNRAVRLVVVRLDYNSLFVINLS